MNRRAGTLHSGGAIKHAMPTTGTGGDAPLVPGW